MNKPYINNSLNIMAMILVIASSLVSDRGFDIFAILASLILILSIISIIKELKKSK